MASNLITAMNTLLEENNYSHVVTSVNYLRTLEDDRRVFFVNFENHQGTTAYVEYVNEHVYGVSFPVFSGFLTFSNQSEEIEAAHTAEWLRKNPELAEMLAEALAE